VNTAAARYQNLAINQTKLSGMCGRLKCCLNYELDTYIDALEDFPDRAERLKTGAGLAILIKTDVFKRLMYYTYADDRSKFLAVHVDQIWEALDMLKSGKIPGSLEDILAMAPQVESDEPDEVEPDFENVHDVIQLPIEKRKKKKKKSKTNRDRSQSAAAAVEKAAQQDDLSQRRPSGRDDRNRRPDNRHQQRPPQQQQPKKDGPPQARQNPAPPQQKTPQGPPENRQTPPPPRKEGEQRPPNPPGDQTNPNKGNNNSQGNNRRRDKRNFKGKG
jgi:pyruvate/2-oxoglutarate dehydrogenase complex dihydrolipoamide acyltransferase (E2) component